MVVFQLRLVVSALFEGVLSLSLETNAPKSGGGDGFSIVRTGQSAGLWECSNICSPDSISSEETHFLLWEFVCFFKSPLFPYHREELMLPSGRSS